MGNICLLRKKKQKQNLKFKNYVLFGDKNENLSLQHSISENSEGLFQKGSRKGRIYLRAMTQGLVKNIGQEVGVSGHWHSGDFYTLNRNLKICMQSKLLIEGKPSSLFDSYSFLLGNL